MEEMLTPKSRAAFGFGRTPLQGFDDLLFQVLREGILILYNG
jgi:hypothetical protein